MLRWIVFLCLVLTPMLGYANSLTLESACVTSKGVPVKYVASREKVWKNNFTLAFAQVRHGVPFIFYDPIALKEAPRDFAIWLLDHECYHVAKPPHLAMRGYSPTFNNAEERLADRYAIRKAIKRRLNLNVIRSTIGDMDYFVRNTPPHLIQKESELGIAPEEKLAQRVKFFENYLKTRGIDMPKTR